MSVLNQQQPEQHEQRVRFQAPKYWYVGTYRKWCLPSRQWQAALLERLRVKWCYSPADFKFMQRLGNWGRKYCAFLDRSRTGGGWW